MLPRSCWLRDRRPWQHVVRTTATPIRPVYSQAVRARAAAARIPRIRAPRARTRPGRIRHVRTVRALDLVRRRTRAALILLAVAVAVHLQLADVVGAALDPRRIHHTRRGLDQGQGRDRGHSRVLSRQDGLTPALHRGRCLVRRSRREGAHHGLAPGQSSRGRVVAGDHHQGRATLARIQTALDRARALLRLGLLELAVALLPIHDPHHQCQEGGRGLRSYS